MARWLLRGLVTYAVLLGVDLVVYRLAYPTWSVTESVTLSILRWIAVPTVVAMVVLYFLGKLVGPVAFRLLAVGLLLLAAFSALLGDALVVGTQVVTQLALALTLAHPGSMPARTLQHSGLD